MAAESANTTAPFDAECTHSTTRKDNDLELCLNCGELVSYFADDVQDWVEVR